MSKKICNNKINFILERILDLIKNKDKIEIISNKKLL